MRRKPMDAKTFDTQFDEGVSVMPYADLSKAERPNKTKRVNVDFPLWMLNALDSEAERLGVTRQSLIKVWMADCLSKKTSEGLSA